MNGHDTHDYFPEYDWRGDDPDTRTGIECPFCRHEVEWDDVFFCLNCEVEWNTKDELEADRISDDDEAAADASMEVKW